MQRTKPRVLLRIGAARPASKRLVGVPYAGAGVGVFRDWPPLLPPSVEVAAVQLPGRGSRIAEPPATSVDEIVSALADELSAPAADGMPYAVFGHSLGALVAFEVAREMRRRDRPLPRHIFVSGRCAPDRPVGVPEIHALPPEEFLVAVGELGGMAPEVLETPELLDLVLPALQADFTAAESYTFVDDEPLACPISAFGGTDDPTSNPDDLAAWGRHTSSEFRLRMLPGDHFFLHSERPSLLAAIAGDLGDD